MPPINLSSAVECARSKEGRLGSLSNAMRFTRLCRTLRGHRASDCGVSCREIGNLLPNSQRQRRTCYA